MDKTKLKKFDLQRALQGDPVCTHDREMITPKNLDSYTISIGLVGGEAAIIYTFRYEAAPLGTLHNVSHPIDLLFMAPKTKTVWVNLYSSPSDSYERYTKQSSEEDADSYDKTDSFERLGNRAYPIEIAE